MKSTNEEVRKTNIVFWFLVLVALVAIWFLLRSCFQEFGGMLIDLFSETKEEITDDSNENEEE